MLRVSRSPLGGPLPSEVFVFTEWRTIYLPEVCVRRTHCHWLIEGTVRMGETVNKQQQGKARAERKEA